MAHQVNRAELDIMETMFREYLDGRETLGDAMRLVRELMKNGNSLSSIGEGLILTVFKIAGKKDGVDRSIRMGLVCDTIQLAILDGYDNTESIKDLYGLSIKGDRIDCTVGIDYDYLSYCLSYRLNTKKELENALRKLDEIKIKSNEVAKAYRRGEINMGDVEIYDAHRSEQVDAVYDIVRSIIFKSYGN